jgi:putative transposase
VFAVVAAAFRGGRLSAATPRWKRSKIDNVTVHFQKPIRVPQSNYQGQQFYFVTICCHDRERVFANSRVCEWLLQIFRTESAGRDFAVHAYCLMPDHFHFLVEVTKPASDLFKFVKSFKIKSSRVYAEKTSQPLWQKKYFDHIVRRNESPEGIAWYIWMNPVRAGLSRRTGQYAFAGSFTGLMDRMVSPPDSWTPPWKTTKSSASEGGRYKT